MASPKTTWKGAIRLGLLNVPITIGKATGEVRERGIKELCADHHVPVDRSERCPKDGCSLDSKVRGVEAPDGTWRVLNGTEYVGIEDSTKRDTLDIEDVQPVEVLPVEYATASYYVRPDDKAPGALGVFAHLAEALDLSGYGLVVKWCSSVTQKLCVIQMVEGVMFMRHIPHANEKREAGQKETTYQEITTDEETVEMLVELLKTKQNPEGFQHESFEDEGAKLRAEAIERLLGGEKIEPKPEAVEKQEVPDIMQMLTATMQQQKEAQPA